MLEQCRHHGNPDALAGLRDGWHISDDLRHLITEGGWWPGEGFYLPLLSPEDVDLAETLGSRRIPAGTATVLWQLVAHIWEQDGCFSPLLKEPQPSAPVALWSTQSMAVAMPFPTEAALLEAFALTIESVPADPEYDPPMFDPFFVWWGVEGAPPPSTVSPEAFADIKAKIAALSAGETQHPCWSPQHMPFMVDLGPEDPEVVALMLGVPAATVQ